MKALFLGLGLLVAATGCAASAQSHSDSNRAAFQQTRDGAKAQALAALSNDHRAKLDALVSKAQSGGFSNAQAAAQAVDAVLSPQESQAVLAARDDMMQKIRAARQSSGEQAGPSRQRQARPGAAAPNDPGYFLLSLELDREQMRSLRNVSGARP